MEQGFCLNLLKPMIIQNGVSLSCIFGFSPDLAKLVPEHSKFKKYLDRISADECRRIEGDGYLKGLIDLTFEKMVSITYWIGNQTS